MNPRDALALNALLHYIGKFQQFAASTQTTEAIQKQVLDLPMQQFIQAAAQIAGDIGTENTEMQLESFTDFAMKPVGNGQWRDDPQQRSYYPITALALSADRFPVVKAETVHYAELWQKFVTEAQRIPLGDFQAHFDSLMHVLHKYTWSVPIGHQSLFDLSRVTAALAVCLHDATETEEPFLLIEGGVSGIQNFIYNPAFNGQELQDGMARRLRGRSFYLNLVVKTLADYLTTELGLYSANTIWATGGHFLIVTPNTEETRSKLAAARKKIQQWVWQEFRGALGLLLVDCPASRDDLKDFSKVRQQLEELVINQKHQQFSAPLSFGNKSPDEAWEKNAWVLKMQQDICRDTGRDLSQQEVEFSELSQKENDDGEQRATRSPQSLLYDCIGRVLIKAESMQLRRTNDWEVEKAARLPRNAEDAEKLSEAYEHVLIEFPLINRTWLLTSSTVPRNDAEVSLRIADHRNESIEFLPTARENPAPKTAQGFQFLADAVKTKLDKKGSERLVGFHDLAESAIGANFLGVLRMDVDGLGYIFSEGLLPEARSLVSIAGLSRMMDWFFTGYLNQLVKDRNLYTTYAGGDDLFIVGAWNEVLEVANTIQQQFQAFCGHHPAWHISAGITLCKGKYPIGRAADDAEERLSGIAKTSKQEYLQGDSDKNALSFLERKISWQRWNEILPLCEQIIEAIKDDKISRKFIHHILELYYQHIDPQRESAKDDNRADFVWLPKFLYPLLRNVKDDHLRIELQEQIPKYKEYLSILTGYVLLKTRVRNNEKTQLPNNLQQKESRKDQL